MAELSTSKLRAVPSLGGVAALSQARASDRTDAEVLEQVREGEAEAFEVLVDRYKNPLVNYLTRLVRCRDRAEDYAQEAFVRIYKGSGSYREQGNFSAYLYRIATNLVRSDERRKSRWFKLTPALTAELDGPKVEGPPPQRSLLSAEATEVVTEAIEHLPLNYRAPIVLREIEGWSYAEIAEALSLAEGTVKSRINRGKERLRRSLEGYWSGS
ncbi:MAG: sigma-70 family RNA polymerase sigma factor [Acidobacteriota bacterium]